MTHPYDPCSTRPLHASRLGRRVLYGTLALLMTLAALLATASPATAQEHVGGIDVSAGFGYGATESVTFFPLNTIDDAEDDFSFGVVALRYHHRFNETWGIEAGLAYKDELTDRAENNLFLDVSARWTMHETDDLEIYAVFGPGILLYDRVFARPFVIDFFDPDADLVFTEETVSDETPTAHIGIGALFDLGSRTYLRADARYRSLLDVFGPLDDRNLEATVGLGLHL